ncbi:MAG: preprotein translocase subunit SecA [Gemmatales bacterium]|nr:preprotein translocase subunit SecA [Gemmatales bacterium]MDW7993807.1 preprotein translocase subunit SecA [Gemmatales bacterium]
MGQKSTFVRDETLPQDLSIWEKISDALSAFSEWLVRVLTLLLGSSNDRALRALGYRKTGNPEKPYEVVPGSLLARINDLEPKMRELSNEELRSLGSHWKQRVANGEPLDNLLVEVFAAVRESARRYKDMRHFDVQILGGIVLHQGKIAEMATGEGKTLVATLPAVLNSLTGDGVHIVTVNDYLARRDCEWMMPIYQGVGITAGYIQSDMDSPQRRRAYECDITYGTNSEFGFDYLRDNMKPARWGDPRYPPYLQQCQRGLNYAIIDEVDNILIDEARTPLIISGPAFGDIERFRLADRVARQLKPGIHFEIKEKEHACPLTEEGIREAERLVGVESFYTAGNMEWPHLIDNALKAHHLYKRDKHYVVMPHPETGEMSVIIVDEFTGRLMIGRQWSDGLHQAIEAKEGVPIKQETQTLATITLQNFFRLYKKIAGMTGTAMTEADEFWKIYKLEVVAIPTNKPLRRIDYPDVIFRTEREKWNAVVQEIVEVHKTGRPILVGTVSVEKSERLGEMLKRRGIKFELLNAKPENAAREAEIIAQAGRIGAVTIATNMAGRGTDIILGGNPEFLAWAKLRHQYPTRLDVPPDIWKKTVDEIEAKEKMKEEGRRVAELGGLHVIGTERHEARRIDNQLRGRAGRQGDPGSSRFFLSLEDDLLRIFAGDWVKKVLTALGMKEGECIESPMVSRQIAKAQKRVEERNFDIRKHLLEYDEVMDLQRRRVYGYRQELLEGANGRLRILQMIRQQLEKAVRRYLDENYPAECFAAFASRRLGVELEAEEFRRCTFEEATRIARERAQTLATSLLHDQIDECFNPAEDPTDWKYDAFRKFLLSRWNIDWSIRKLQQTEREQLVEKLLPEIEGFIERLDLQEGASFFEPDFGLKSLCDWANRKFILGLHLDELRQKDAEQLVEFLYQRCLEMYLRRDVEFPVLVGLARFLPERPVGPLLPNNRAGLLAWARQRFAPAAELLRESDFESLSRQELQAILYQASRRSYPSDGLERIERKIDEILGEKDTLSPAQAEQLATWAQQTLQLTVSPDQLQQLSRRKALQVLSNAFDDRYRPEMRTMERSLLLNVLDAAWKDHLYAMDYLRAGVGLVGYAQIDPKSEYKRQGMKQFEVMWENVADRVTDLIFRMEEAGYEVMETVWQITAAVHEAPPSAFSQDGIRTQQEQALRNSQQGEAKRIEPIRNSAPRVGRNDPCPCGSGKKYKHCCMKLRR